MQRILVPIFTFIWWNRLKNESSHIGLVRDHVVKVKGWRTAIVDKPGYGRQTITFCFWKFQ